MTKSGEPCLHSSPGKTHHKVKANIGPRRRMQQRTYPFVSVILSPGSKIGHTPRKNPSPSGAGNLPHQRISRLAQDACNYLHKPFAAKKDYSTVSHKLQVFFGVFAKFFTDFLRSAEVCRLCTNCPVFAKNRAEFGAIRPIFVCRGEICGVSQSTHNIAIATKPRAGHAPPLPRGDFLLPRRAGRLHPARAARLILYIIR